MLEAELGDVQAHEEADEVRGREDVGGILLHHLFLLVANKGGVANLRGLGPSGPGQGRLSHPLTKESGDHRIPQTLGPTQTHERHVKLGKGGPRERHNKGYTREHGGVEGGGGMRTTGRGVSKTPTNTTLEPLYCTVVQQYTT